MTADPIVCLHGITSSRTTWGGLVLATKPHGIDPHCLTLLGHGPVGARRRVDGYSLEAFVGDAMAQINRLGLERFQLIGHSLGAHLASIIASSFPRRISRLVLEELPVPARSRTDSGPVRHRWSGLAVKIGALSGYRHFDPVMVSRVLDQLDAPRPGWWQGLARITMPVLMIGGGTSSYLDQERLPLVAAELPDVRLVGIDGGHRVHITREAEFLAQVVPFLLEPDQP
ncbi:alpha/beta fold hydrolase [Acidipropionibacterium virtanenii]|uniref:Tropinesterase n=1 Tax=Acidipropionibacterium virtanenii TaxID=2057246 RepID=A0A344UVB7_9ACTN|nr:alpha/beta hydrolase [Acidipropionibacterium virtanenii]AXE39215.1 Tropinesterase [Acidipropionibacterium virtanenii]